jgi:hypothetical protein
LIDFGVGWEERQPFDSVSIRRFYCRRELLV